jgi:very-short-patch-repair endonuclease
MSPTELKLYSRLVSAFPNYLVFTQVQLSQAVQAPSGMDQFRWNNRINRMSLDFVICERSSNPICVIELDDKTHLRDSVKIRDEKKDKALNAAEIPIVRIKVAEMPTVAQLPKLLGIVA